MRLEWIMQSFLRFVAGRDILILLRCTVGTARTYRRNISLPAWPPQVSRRSSRTTFIKGVLYPVTYDLQQFRREMEDRKRGRILSMQASAVRERKRAKHEKTPLAKWTKRWVHHPGFELPPEGSCSPDTQHPVVVSRCLSSIIQQHRTAHVASNRSPR